MKTEKQIRDSLSEMTISGIIKKANNHPHQQEEVMSICLAMVLEMKHEHYRLLFDYIVAILQDKSVKNEEIPEKIDQWWKRYDSKAGPNGATDSRIIKVEKSRKIVRPNFKGPGG